MGEENLEMKKTQKKKIRREVLVFPIIGFMHWLSPFGGGLRGRYWFFVFPLISFTYWLSPFGGGLRGRKNIK
jgi:hypothetical protein